LPYLITLLKAGLQALLEYLSAHVLTCLVPAFFIAGGIAVFVSQASVMKYFGARAKKVLSYSVASVSGTILAVCSCTVLPLFAGIHKRGAGLGPAIAFLYSGPAINVLAIVYSARLLGFDLGAARAIGAVSFSILIGLAMAFLFRHEKRLGDDLPLMEEIKTRPLWKTTIYFAVLVGILILGAAKQWLVTGLLLALLLLLLKLWFKKEEIGEWMRQTWSLAWKIAPILLVGVFVAGMLKALLPEAWVRQVVGGNGLVANLVASIFGAFMYFSTLTEVPIVKAFLDMGMGKGPALALLLAGPALSLPSMIVLIRIMGLKKTGAYVGLVVVMATFTGMGFGFLFP
jgi:uncharacterized membrane protein YraQ (UPF0718 family)